MLKCPDSEKNRIRNSKKIHKVLIFLWELDLIRPLAITKDGFKCIIKLLIIYRELQEAKVVKQKKAIEILIFLESDLFNEIGKSKRISTENCCLLSDKNICLERNMEL